MFPFRLAPIRASRFMLSGHFICMALPLVLGVGTIVYQARYNGRQFLAHEAFYVITMFE